MPQSTKHLNKSIQSSDSINTGNTSFDSWNSDFHTSSALFRPLNQAQQALNTQYENWPSLDDYNQLISTANNEIKNNNQKKITFVKQEPQCSSFKDEYEPRIFLTGNVQTRLNNWHDFFQVLVWKTFPKTKSLLNEIHYHAACQRQKTAIKQRSKEENFVTLFDECGSIILSTKKKHLDQVKNFEWKAFFLENKTEFGKTIDCIVFGHAMYEKALSPYIGMTSHCLLLEVDMNYFHLTSTEKYQYVDNAILNHIKNINNLNTKSLTPLPILGIPNWYNNQTEEFYNNKNYFRTGRGKK